ncbi:MAG: 50S ribosomal protein L17 [Planctomycetes bacterium]|nr:50S ribosomal protein L17 [Planctomycetota bacterium]
MRRNLVASLFEHGSVVTTVAKAKSFRPFAEKLITLARRGNARKAEGTPQGKAAHLHAFRRAAQLMPHRPAVRTLFGRVAPAAGDREGGYTRIVRLGKARIGDRAPLALFQLVDKPAAPAEAAPEAAGEKKGKGAGKGEAKAEKKGRKTKAAAAAE